MRLVASENDVEDLLSLCSLRAGGRLFGIDTRMIREVLGKGRMRRVPLAPLFVGGVIAYRGEVVTAVSLRALLGIEEAETESCVLVLDGDESEEPFGLMVDGVGGVVMVDRRTMSANPSTLDDASRALFSGAFRTDEGLLVQLDPEKLKPVHWPKRDCSATPAEAGEWRCHARFDCRRFKLHPRVCAAADGAAGMAVRRSAGWRSRAGPAARGGRI